MLSSISQFNVGFYIICKRLTSNSSDNRDLFIARPGTATAQTAAAKAGIKQARDGKQFVEADTEMEINDISGPRMDLVE